MAIELDLTNNKNINSIAADTMVQSSPVSTTPPPSSGDDDTTRTTLRWNRLVKTVQVHEKNAGLMRGSIAGPASSSNNHNNSNTSSGTPPEASLKSGPMTKTILSRVSGFAAPGEVLALMGPSGSGKTSLLNCLSGRTSYSSGVLSVNGTPITQKSAAMKRLMAKVVYVKQEDIFFTHLTVRDQLLYTAFLRLPQAWSKEQKVAEVERIIKLLRLSKVKESPIFLLSGGEKKRVNIGTELLTNPSCLLLDEPTRYVFYSFWLCDTIVRQVSKDRWRGGVHET
jgi:ABC-type lipoprotein export system ATPase subunit